jgi:hypothetical protein
MEYNHSKDLKKFEKARKKRLTSEFIEYGYNLWKLPSNGLNYWEEYLKRV